MKKASIKRRIKIIPGYFKRIGLKNRCFSILSNNCWGGAVYDTFSLQYKTPTIGLYFMAEDYIKFLENPSQYLKLDLKQCSWENVPFKQSLVDGEKETKKSLGKSLDDMIIAQLCDIYIVFLHYNSWDEAVSKWNRRKKRLDMDNLIVKFNDQNGFSRDLFERFDALPFKNKIFYTADDTIRSNGSTTVIYLPEYKDDGYVISDMNFSNQQFNIKKYLNTMIR